MSTNMCDPTDNFDWTHRLECPPTICTTSVKKILNKGLLEHLWVEIGNSVFTASEVNNVRKNILLHKLRNKLDDTAIQCTKNISALMERRNKLKLIASSLKEKYEQEDFLIRHKVQKLKQLKSERGIMKLKKDILKMKYNETYTEFKNCNDAKLILQNLMPNTCKEVDKDKIRESLGVITTLSYGADKKEVRSKISNLLGHIEIPTLWAHLYQTLQQDLDDLMKLKDTEISENLKTFGENIDIGIARMCGQHICMVSKQFFYDNRAKKFQDVAMEYIDKIEASCKNNIDISEWLSLSLEKCKLETEKAGLQQEIEKMKDNNHNNKSSSNLSQLVSQMEIIDTEIKKYVEYIQQSFVYLNSAESTIKKMRDNLSKDLMKITLIQGETYDFKWLNHDLTTELNIFNDKLDLNALNKIVLQGEIKAPRYVTSCLKEASTLLVPVKTYKSICSFPIIQTPVFCLFDCYKHLVVYHIYKTIESSASQKCTEPCLPELMQQNNNCDIMEIMQLSQQNCDEAMEEIKQFHFLLQEWSDQNIQEVMSIVDRTVDNLSFRNWVSRYDK